MNRTVSQQTAFRNIQVFLGGLLIGGCEELQAALSDGSFKDALDGSNEPALPSDLREAVDRTLAQSPAVSRVIEELWLLEWVQLPARLSDLWEAVDHTLAQLPAVRCLHSAIVACEEGRKGRQGRHVYHKQGAREQQAVRSLAGAWTWAVLPSSA